MTFTFNGKIELVKDGEAIMLLPEPDSEGNRVWFLSCCDCGLTHRALLTPTEMRVWRVGPEIEQKIVMARLRARLNMNNAAIAQADGDVGD